MLILLQKIETFLVKKIKLAFYANYLSGTYTNVNNTCTLNYYMVILFHDYSILQIYFQTGLGLIKW